MPVAWLREGGVVTAVYLVATFAILQPLLSDPAGSMPDPRAMFEGRPAFAAFKDGFLLAWLYAWGWHALTTDPLALYDANAFHPYSNTLALSPHSVGKAVTAGPIFGLTGNPVLAYEIDLALCFALSGAAVYLFLRHVGVGAGAAFLAGAVFTFSPARLGIYFHTHLLGWMYLPIAMILLDRTLLRGRIGAASGLALLLLIQCLCSYYLAFMTLIGIATYGAVFALVAWRQVIARGFALALLAGGVACGLLLLISGPYFESRSLGVIPDFAQPERIDFARAHSTHVRDYLLPARKAYLGWLPMAVAALAILGSWRTAHVGRRAALAGVAAVTVVAAVLSLGPDLHVGGRDIPLPFRLLAQVVPGFSSIRAPDRFQQLAVFGFSFLVGFGLDAVARRLSLRARPAAIAAGVLFATAVAVEYRVPWRTFAAEAVPSTARALPIHAALADQPPGPVAEFPFHGSMGLDAARAMVRSTLHWQPLVNGKSGYEPRGREHILRLAERVLENARAFEAFVRVTGTRYVVIDEDGLSRRDRRAWGRMQGVDWIREDGRFRLGVVDEALPRDGVEVARECAAPTSYGEACERLAAYGLTANPSVE